MSDELRTSDSDFLLVLPRCSRQRKVLRIVERFPLMAKNALTSISSHTNQTVQATHSFTGEQINKNHFFQILNDIFVSLVISSAKLRRQCRDKMRRTLPRCVPNAIFDLAIHAVVQSESRMAHNSKQCDDSYQLNMLNRCSTMSSVESIRPRLPLSLCDLPGRCCDCKFMNIVIPIWRSQAREKQAATSPKEPTHCTHAPTHSHKHLNFEVASNLVQCCLLNTGTFVSLRYLSLSFS